MAAKPENVVADIGKQLAEQSRPTKDFLIKSLRQAASALSELDQLSSLKLFVRPLSQSLVKHDLLHHKDKDVKLLVAVCFCEIIRVLAPDPSFDDKTFKGIFELFIGMFMELADTTSPYFSRRVKVLGTVASLECCRRMLDLDCDDLILKMFKTFFSVVREEHQRSLIDGMLSIMSLVLNEDEVPQPLLEVVLLNLRSKGEGRAPAYHLAAALLQNCTEKIKPIICGFLTSCILDRESVKSVLKNFYHDIIFEIFRCTPHVLLAVIPNLVQELLTDQVDVRIRSVDLIGKLLTLPKGHDIHEHHYLFVELLKRFSDKSAEVRISVIRAVKSCYMADPSGTESHKILSSLEGRLLDIDASVRIEAVAVICDLARFNYKNFPETHIACVTDRLRDKMISVRKEASRKLMEVYREYCTKCFEGQMTLTKCYEQIPCKMLMLSYEKNLKEFRLQTLELLLAGELFPTSLPVEDRTRHWIYLYSLFVPAHAKVLNLVLCQKRRFQKEMREYLSYRRKDKGIDLEEVNVRTKNAFTQMSATFPNPVKAEESFHKLNQLNDSSIFDILLQLLDEPVFSNAKAMREKLLIGDKSLHVEFLEALYLKCSHNIFSAEHVHYILDHVSSSRDTEDHLDRSSFSLLSDIIRSFPLLLRGSEHLFKTLMLKEDSALCTKLAQMLANIGPYVSIELGEIYPLLEKLSLEGSRAQAKAAVSAIATLMGPCEQFLVVDLCQKLVESLHVGWNLPTVLQSLGCISQHFVSAFKSQENEVSSYINERIFKGKITEDGVQLDKKSASDVSSDCQMKIYGLKTLVKGALQKTEVRGGEQISKVLDILSKALLTGEFAEGATICENDMAHIKLAAAISVLRLSRRWDLHISPQMFQSTIMMAKDAPGFVRKAFLDKTHKLLKENAASIRFACAFALAASDSVKDLQDASLKYLVEFVKKYGRAAPRSPASDSEGSLTYSPAYVVVFLLHVLAHDAEFPPLSSHSEELFAQFCRPLVLILQVLVNPQIVDGNLVLVQKNFLNLRSIFRAIKRAEDVIDLENSPKLHILADIGISILDMLKRGDINFSLAPGLVLLPSSLYRSLIRKAEEDNNCQIGFVVTEDFVRKIVSVREPDFSQVWRTNVTHGRKRLKESLQDQNISDFGAAMKVDMLGDVRTQEKIEKETAKIDFLVACPKEKQQTTAVHSSSGTLPMQDDSSVIEELDSDIENLNCLGMGGHHLNSKSEALELFGTVSDVSTEEVDVSLSISQQLGRKRKNSCESAESLSKTKLRQYCSSDGSTDSILRQCVPEKLCLGDNVKDTTIESGEDAAEKRRKEVGKRKVLLDTTNSLPVNGLQKHRQPEKSCRGSKVDLLDISGSDDSDVSKDAVAFRTRRRKV